MTDPSTRTSLLIVNEFHKETIDKLDRHFDTHKLWLHPVEDRARLIEQLRTTCKAVATASWVTDSLIYDLPDLEIISCFGVGVDGIDFEITRSRKIQVTNTPKVLNDAVADVAIALILATQRYIVMADRFVREGSWRDGPFLLGSSLAGKTLGIIGLGSIGEDIAKRAETFKLKIAYHNRNPKDLPYAFYSSLVELAEKSDLLLCLLPGGDETDKVIDREVFSALGADGTFINIGRGSTVNEADLITALQDGTIANAGLDVYNDEPHVQAEFLQMENVTLLPHIGSATLETRRAMGDLVIENLLAWTDGQPLLTPVN